MTTESTQNVPNVLILCPTSTLRSTAIGACLLLATLGGCKNNTTNHTHEAPAEESAGGEEMVAEAPEPEAAPEAEPVAQASTAPVAEAKAAPAASDSDELVEPEESKSKPVEVDATLAAKRSKDFAKQKGKMVAFWVWSNGKHGWQIATTSDGTPHRFAGRITGPDAGLTTIKTKGKEVKDRFQPTKNGKGFFFNFKTSTGADGITFKAKDNRCVRMRFMIDGQDAKPNQIMIGGEGARAPASLIRLCTPEEPEKPGKANKAQKADKAEKGSAKKAEKAGK